MALRYVLWHLAFGYMGPSRSAGLYFAHLVGATYIFTNFAVYNMHKDVIPKTKHIS